MTSGTAAAGSTAMAALRKRGKRFSRKWVRRSGIVGAGRTVVRRAYALRGGIACAVRDTVALPDGGAFVSGLLVDPQQRVTSLAAEAEDGARQPVDDSLVRWRDTRVAVRHLSLARGSDTRFAARVPAGTVALRFELADGGHRRLDVDVPTRETAPLDAIRGVLSRVPSKVAGKRAAFDRLYGPVVRDLSTRRRIDGFARGAALARTPACVVHNPELAAHDPAASIVVPVHGRWDFIEHQLARFANDVSLTRHELLYVIDDPRIEAEVRAACHVLARLYRIAFKVVYLPENLGYAGANNAGVALARGRHLVLLNSDVIPTTPGWVDAMLTAAGTAADDTVVGARLLYEDGAVQHDGMRFFENPFHDGLWTNVHPSKGLPADLLPAPAGLVDREAVTGACMLLSRERYVALGGLDEGYVLGDFEDSDLCLAAHAAGLRVALAPSVTLWHLERQSQDLDGGGWKQELSFYNGWLHTERRDADIRRLRREDTA